MPVSSEVYLSARCNTCRSMSGAAEIRTLLASGVVYVSYLKRPTGQVGRPVL